MKNSKKNVRVALGIVGGEPPQDSAPRMARYQCLNVPSHLGLMDLGDTMDSGNSLTTEVCLFLH